MTCDCTSPSIVDDFRSGHPDLPISERRKCGKLASYQLNFIANNKASQEAEIAYYGEPRLHTGASGALSVRVRYEYRSDNCQR